MEWKGPRIPSQLNKGQDHFTPVKMIASLDMNGIIVILISGTYAV
jgi:hypothetical protein